jgi:hypothetical protein
VASLPLATHGLHGRLLSHFSFRTLQLAHDDIALTLVLSARHVASLPLAMHVLQGLRLSHFSFETLQLLHAVSAFFFTELFGILSSSPSIT